MIKKITICMGSSCYVRGNEKNLQILEEFLRSHGLDTEVELCGENCARQCSEGPNIQFDETIYHKVNEEMLIKLLNELAPLSQSGSDKSNES